MNDQRVPPKNPKHAGAGFSNSESTVGAQGFFNDEVTIYVAGPSDPPERRLEVAKNYLAAMLPSQAQELLVSVIGDGHLVGEAAYYWMLAILSGKGLTDLDQEGRSRFQSAWKKVQETRGPWLTAATVIKNLIVLLQEPHGSAAETANMDQVLASFDDLPEQRCEEIRRHLDTLFTAGLRRQLEFADAERIRAQRLGNRRKERAPKFFEPNPYPPQSTLSPRPTLSPAQAMPFSLAVLMGATGALGGGVLLFEHRGFTGVLLTAATTGWAMLLAWFAPARFPVRFSPWQADPAPKTSEKMTAAVKRVFERVRHNSSDGESTEGWIAATWAVRAAVAREYASVYGSPKIPPGSTDYLIARHAREAWKQFRAGTLGGPSRGAVLFDCTGAAFAASLLACVVLLLSAEPTLAAFPIGLVFCAGLLLPLCRGDVLLVRILHRSRERSTAVRRLRLEEKLYTKRQEELADRPDDTEMARWLDDDKHYFRTLVLNEYGMESKDIIAEAVLSEPARKARRSRVRRGPWRYSAYILWIYLLTSSGVRQIVVHLDFASGTLSDQRRTAFRYDAVASASIIEIGICFDEHGRAIAPPQRRRRRPKDTEHESEANDSADMKAEEKPGPEADEGPEPEPVMVQLFQLILINRQLFEVTVEQLAEIDETVGDVTYLRRLALDNSGVTSALRILEQVAAEGGDWVRLARMQAEQLVL